MIVCHCTGVTDRDLRRAAASGARSLEAVARTCGAGAGCGGCRPLVREVLGRTGAAAPPGEKGGHAVQAA